MKLTDRDREPSQLRDVGTFVPGATKTLFEMINAARPRSPPEQG